MKTQTKWVIALAVVVSGVWLLGLFYVLSCNPDVSILTPIVVSVPSPVATPVQQNHLRTLDAQPMIHHAAYQARVTYNSQIPMATMMPYKGLYATSNAQVQHVGGGGSGNVIATTTHLSPPSNHVVYSTVNVVMPTTNFVAMASQRQVAEPAAQEAPQMARLASMRRAPGPPNPTGPLPEDNQLVEHPLGDALWPMMLLALAYIGIVLQRKKS